MLRNRRFQSLHASQPRSVYRHFDIKRVSHERSERNACITPSPPAVERAPSREVVERIVEELDPAEPLTPGLPLIFRGCGVADRSGRGVEHFAAAQWAAAASSPCRPTASTTTLATISASSEHAAPNAEPGDVVVLGDGREALVTVRVEPRRDRSRHCWR